MEQINLNKLVLDVEQVITQAGDILLSHFRKETKRVDKANGQGFVTEADTVSEQFLIENLTKLFPQASIYAEESGKSGKSVDGYCWVIDPLDGTTNFAYGIPYFSISIALTHNNIPILGVVYDPITKDLFTAISGNGTYLNKQKIQVSKINKLEKACLLLSVPYVKDHDYEKLLKVANIIDMKSFVTRQLGSVVLDAAYVACGRVDGYYFNNLAWWDVAAGMLLIQEAGGLVTDFSGGPIIPGYKTCVGANPQIYGQIKSILAGY